LKHSFKVISCSFSFVLAYSGAELKTSGNKILLLYLLSNKKETNFRTWDVAETLPKFAMIKLRSVHARDNFF
jgi:hypothetical protein